MTEKSIALGTFDGFHLGHTAVLTKAAESEYPAVVLLFDCHPMSIFAGVNPPELLTDSIRKKLTSQIGIEPVIINFKNIYRLTPEQFFYDVLIKRFNAAELSCGENYTFGADGKGNVSLLKTLCNENGIKLNIAPTQMLDNDVISSTKIRSLIEAGDIVRANKMLGRAFSYDFKVVSGDRRGRKLGFPTINQFFPDNFVKMKFGVYASAAFVDGEYHAAVTNFGIRPTIGTDSLRSETCILGFSGNLYGENVEVYILEFLRDEQKFKSLSELTDSIKHDADKAEEIFNKSLALL